MLTDSVTVSPPEQKPQPSSLLDAVARDLYAFKCPDGIAWDRLTSRQQMRFRSAALIGASSVNMERFAREGQA